MNIIQILVNKIEQKLSHYPYRQWNIEWRRKGCQFYQSIKSFAMWDSITIGGRQHKGIKILWLHVHFYR